MKYHAKRRTAVRVDTGEGDRFHVLYPFAREPVLPIHDYRLLLETRSEEEAFRILRMVQEGQMTMQDVERQYLDQRT